MQRHFERRRRGLTLLEAIMTMFFMVVIIAGVMTLYYRANTNQKMSQAASQFGAVTQAVRSVYSTRSNYTGVQTTDLVTALPANMIEGDELRHSFNGKITVVAADAGFGAGSGFNVTYAGLPGEACQTLVAQDYGRAIVAVRINGTSVAVPVTPTIANNSCLDATNNSVMWTVQ